MNSNNVTFFNNSRVITNCSDRRGRSQALPKMQPVYLKWSACVKVLSRTLRTLEYNLILILDRLALGLDLVARKNFELGLFAVNTVQKYLKQIVIVYSLKIIQLKNALVHHTHPLLNMVSLKFASICIVLNGELYALYICIQVPFYIGILIF